MPAINKPFDNSNLVDHLSEVRQVVSTTTFWIGEHELKVDVVRGVFDPFEFHYTLYERKVVLNEAKGETLEAWVFATIFPLDVGATAEEALAAAIRWTKDYYPKKA